MDIDFRKLGIALVIAVLFSIFVQTSIDAIKPQPQYEDYCDMYSAYSKPWDNMTESERVAQQEKERACQDAWSTAQEKYNFVVFIVSALAGLVAVIIGLYINSTTPVGMAIASGMILGGLLSLFIGTMRGWSGIILTIRPFIILIELLIVIWVSYRKLNKK